ncbi:7477_t:CDS:2, partial [Diversispora eburnea]
KVLSILPTQEEQIEIPKDLAPEKLLEVYKKNGQFNDATKYLRSLEKSQEASVMLSNNLDKDENIIDSFCYLLHSCRVIILVDTMNNDKSTLKEKELHKLLNDALDITTKVKSQSLKKSEKWSRLMEEFQLYLAYRKSDLNEVHKCIQSFKRRNDTIIEFQALTIWLKIQPKSINIEYWHERLQYLIRLCELAYDFIDPHKNVHNKEKINKNFEEIFFVEEVQDRPDKRKISFDDLLVCHIIKMYDKNTIEDLKVYNVDIMYKAIAKFLALYIDDLISKAHHKGKDISDIAYEICNDSVKCKSHYCQKHHLIPTPSILHKRITLACLQYTVTRKLDTICFCILSYRNIAIQRFWAERLIEYHFHYQSPQSSCPEITHAAIIKLPRHTYNGLVDLIYKVWLGNEFDPCDFAKMLKCIFVLLQLRCKWGIDKFHLEIRKNEKSYNNFAAQVAKRLALFVESLRTNLVIEAINQSKKFINYAVKNSEQVKIDTSRAFSDLTSLIEFTTFLILAARPGYCDFCLPRSYLVNYYDVFDLNPSLICLEGINKYNIITYNNEITDLFDQVKKILEEIIVINQSHFVNILDDDLKENGFDSLVIVYHIWGGMSRFSWEKFGITKISYRNIEEFRSSLRKITTNVPNDQISFQPADG